MFYVRELRRKNRNFPDKANTYVIMKAVKVVNHR